MSFTIILFFFCFLLFLYIPVPWSIGRILRKIQKTKAIIQNQLFLTFDDGPGCRLTPQILKILKENNIKATFFILGKNIAGREDILKAVIQDGHTIALHSFSHYHSWKVMPWKSVSDIKKGWKTINYVLAIDNKTYAYRPPYGKMNILFLIFLWLNNIMVVFWTVDCRDTWAESKRDVNFAARKIREDRGGIVLFHDFDRATETVDAYVIESLKAAIKAGKDIGLTFSTVDQLTQKES